LLFISIEWVDSELLIHLEMYNKRLVSSTYTDCGFKLLLIVTEVEFELIQFLVRSWTSPRLGWTGPGTFFDCHRSVYMSV